MKFSYLVDAANNIAGAIQYIEKDSKLVLDPRSLNGFLEHGCVSLRQISSDNDFRQLLLDKSRLSFDQQFDGNHLEQYLSSFIKVDKGLMLEAGMSRKVADYLYSDVDSIRRALRGGKTPDFEVMLNRFGDLARLVCDERASKLQDESRRDLVRKMVKSIGGAAVIAVNAASDVAATFGAASKVSIAIGGGLLKAAFK